MDKKRSSVPLVCHGHSRPVVDLFYSPITPDGFFLISASKGNDRICFLPVFAGSSFYSIMYFDPALMGND